MPFLSSQTFFREARNWTGSGGQSSRNALATSKPISGGSAIRQVSATGVRQPRTRNYEVIINFTANATGDTYTFSGGSLWVQVSGTWGSGTLALQIDVGNGMNTEYTWVEAEEMRLFTLPSCSWRLVLSGATSPDIDAVVKVN